MESGGHSDDVGGIQPDPLEESLFFFDASPMTSWPVPATQYTTSSHLLGTSESENFLFEEPPYDPDAEYTEPGAKQCFNCMSTKHIVTDCPHKRNAQHIALARADYGSKSGGGGRTMRLHEAEEGTKRRMGFVKEFEPGYVKGETLRESLGLSIPYGGGNEDLPWYDGMCEWGYPPGWVSFVDPREEVMTRIKASSFHDSMEGLPPLAIFEDMEELTEPAPSANPPTSHHMGHTEFSGTDNSTIPNQKSAPANIPATISSSSSDFSLSLDSNSSPPTHPASVAPAPPEPTSSPLPPPGYPPPPDNSPSAPPSSDRLPVSLVSRRLPSLEEPPPPPPPISAPSPPPLPSTPPPPPPEEPPKTLSEQERRKLLWERILAGQMGQ
ncbi:hypothetical protein FRC07_004896 [Ceratobasidium sp. 392]|nr:hypothetical protein FRC07_004896 [Ceratobasidium sp. 392]